MAIFLNKFDRNTFSIQLPHIFEELKVKNRNVEIVASNTLQPLKLSFSHNTVTESAAVIFVNTEVTARVDDIP